MATDLPDDLIDLQRRAHAAWDAVEAHRKAVDADRATTAQPPGERHERPVLRPWTDTEDERHEQLLAEARSAQEALRAGLADAGIAPTYDVVQGLHKAARQE